jgi:hypothetical protein
MNPVLDFLPREPPGEPATSAERLIASEPGVIFEHLRAAPGGQQALESLRARVSRLATE